MMKARALASILLLAAALGAAGQARIPLNGWKYAAGDDAARSGTEFDDSAWEAIELPMNLRTGSIGGIYWLRHALPAEELRKLGAVEKGLWIMSGKAGSAYELYANGTFVGSRGSLPPRYSIRATQASALFVPSALVAAGESLTLALRCSGRGSVVNLLPFSAGDAGAKDFELKTINFWNSRLYMMLTTLCVFLGCYFLVLYLFRRMDVFNGYFAASLFFVSCYFYEMGAEYLLFTGTWFRAMSRGSLLVSMVFLGLFLGSFFGYLKKPVWRIAGLGVGAAFMAAFLLASRDESVVVAIFNLSLIPVFALIGLCIYVCLRAIRERTVEAWPIAVGIIVALVFATHDTYYQARGAEPMAWLQGLSFFSLDLAIFVALSMRQSRLKSDIERYASEASKSSAELGDSLRRLSRAGAEVARMGRELGAEMAAVGEAAVRADEGTRRIDEKARAQVALAGDADALVGDFLSSIERVSGRLEEQAAGVELTAQASMRLSERTQIVARAAGRTADFTRGLAELTGAGDAAAKALGEAMDRAAEASRGIAGILDAVNEFAERTNLLAMNASIEAAHSGAQGRGFGVIASEIKKLALAQAESAARIRIMVGAIGERIGEGAADADRVRASLESITRGAADAASSVSELQEGAEEQMRAGGEIRNASEALSLAVGKIREEAERQLAYSDRVRGVIAGMSGGTAEVRETAGIIAGETAGVVASMRRLKGLSDASLALVEEMAAREA
jgi:methyl-accepting chemotaxis protein